MLSSPTVRLVAPKDTLFAWRKAHVKKQNYDVENYKLLADRVLSFAVQT